MSIAAFAIIGVVLLSVPDASAVVVRGRGRNTGPVGAPRERDRSEAAAFSLRGRAKLEIGGGWRHHPDNWRSATYANDRLAAADGAVGRVGLAFWTNDNAALTMNYTIHDVETNSLVDDYGYRYEHTTLVHSLLFGMRFYMSQPRRYSPVLPYLSAEAGPFFGTAAISENDDCNCDDNVDTRTMTVAAARLGGGIDFMVGPQFMVGFNGGYNFVEDFAEPIGGRYDYSGSDFGMSFSFLFGRGSR
jgi:hypothetical protein